MPNGNSVTEKLVTHTPGPWRCEVGTMGSFVGDPTEKLIAPHYVLNRTGNAAQIVRQDEAHANARLIAAAPELLAASKLFTDACHEVVLALNGAGLACPSSIAFAAEQARHAIAKAEGRS